MNGVLLYILIVDVPSFSCLVYGAPVNPVVVEISEQTESRLHIKIYDPNNKRWEIPTRYIQSCSSKLLIFLSYSFSPAPSDPSTSPSSTLYTYKYPDKGSDFSFSIMR